MLVITRGYPLNMVFFSPEAIEKPTEKPTRTATGRHWRCPVVATAPSSWWRPGSASKGDGGVERGARGDGDSAWEL